jgi:hypothetical protein
MELDMTRRSKKLVTLAYLARRHRLVNPRGTFDDAGRWYDGPEEGPRHPNVRAPSYQWPYSYMLACRTRKWCMQLPIKTLREDAEVAQEAIRKGLLFQEPDGRWEVRAVGTITTSAITEHRRGNLVSSKRDEMQNCEVTCV